MHVAFDNEIIIRERQSVKKCISAVFAVLIITNFCNEVKSEIRYMVTDISGKETDIISRAFGINNRGQIGVDGRVSGKSGLFIYTEGKFDQVGPETNDITSGYAINDLGQVVGRSFRNGTFGGYPFIDRGDELIDFNDGDQSRQGALLSINNLGDAVGVIDIGDHAEGFTYVGKQIGLIGTFESSGTSLIAINDLGHMAGNLNVPDWSSREAFIYADGKMKRLGTLGGEYSYAVAMNNRDQVAGMSLLKDDNLAHVFLYSDGVMKDIGSNPDSYLSVSDLNIHGQIVGFVAYSIKDPNHLTYHAYLFSEKENADLNTLIDPTSGWELHQAYGNNDWGQIIGTGLFKGKSKVFLLTPLGGTPIQAIQKQPERPTYGDYPVKEEGKDSLVVVTHGWIKSDSDPTASTKWVEVMTNHISEYFVNNNINNWQLCGYRWINYAHIPNYQGGPETAIRNSRQIGQSLGLKIYQQKYSRVHFISHSAGAGLIQAATDVIKKHNPSVQIQETFLDPYVGADFSGTSWYGTNANWADNYSSKDKETGNHYLSFTYNILLNAYNVDVTRLDVANRVNMPYWTTGNDQPCYVTESTHGWPVEFYQNTIIGNTTKEYEGFGFQLSQEATEWDSVSTRFKVGNTSPGHILGHADPNNCRFKYPVPYYPSFIMDFIGNPSIQSDTGTIEKYLNGSFVSKSGSPVWIVTSGVSTNVINTVSFDATFGSLTGSEGLLTVYWKSNIVGSIDQRYVQDGFQHYSFQFPKNISNESYSLGFRLDPFTKIQSVVIVTNVIVSVSGVSEPFLLKPTGNTSDSYSLQLIGQKGFEYRIQSSDDLFDWKTIAVIVNTTGSVQFIDTDTTGSSRRFYRAIVP